MGAFGDYIQQEYDIIKDQSKVKSSVQSNANGYQFKRGFDMSMAGLTTGLVSHYWYILLDHYLGNKKCLKTVTLKVLLDQILFSPFNLTVYFSTLGLCEMSSLKRVKNEIVEKGLENIYIIEWLIWPPAQYFNFYVLPLKYRILFDNIISLGFDIYSPYVKYKTELREEKESKMFKH